MAWDFKRAKSLRSLVLAVYMKQFLKLRYLHVNLVNVRLKTVWLEST